VYSDQKRKRRKRVIGYWMLSGIREPWAKKNLPVDKNICGPAGCPITNQGLRKTYHPSRTQGGKGRIENQLNGNPKTAKVKKHKWEKSQGKTEKRNKHE